MYHVKDLSGQHFGKLVAIEQSGYNNNGNAMWKCECECGNETIVSNSALQSGNTKSCGCLRGKHGKSQTRLYRIWALMKSRCYNPLDSNYIRYGALGITVCDEWRYSFSCFDDWAIAHGYTDELTLDRISPYKNYEPSNCRWATYKIQENNRSNNVVIVYDNEIHTLSEWAEILGVNYKTLWGRINNYGWTVERAFGKVIKHG